MAAKIGALSVSLSAETGQFEAGMKRAQRTANQTRSAFQKSFGGLGSVVKAGFAGVVSGLSVGLLVQGTRAALEYAGSLKEIAETLGVTTKDLQAFRYAAGQVGVSQEQLENGLQKLTITLGQMKAGAEAPRKALEALQKGLANQVAAAPDTGAAFRLIAEAMSKVTDRTQRAAVEVALFKKSGAGIDNLLSGAEGNLNDFSAAAEKLGIVLSDEQIQNADRTADKLEALQTVLKAQIAGVVADNAAAIFNLADSFAQLVADIARAAAVMASFANSAPSWAKKIAGGASLIFNPIGTVIAAVREQANKPGSSVTVDLPPARARVKPSQISNFLAGGDGRKKNDDAERQKALRQAFQFDQDMIRAQQDTLRAQQSLSTDYTERANIGIELLNLDQQAYQRELDYGVASKDITKAQAAQLKAEFDKKNAIERTAVRAEEEAQRYDDYNKLDQTDFDLQRDILESQLQIADTAKEQRDIRLRLLDLDYRAEKARLEAVIADEQASWAAKEDARRRLANLNKTFGNDRAGVIRDTAGPFDRAKLQFGDITDELEQLKVDGIMGAVDALTQLTDGFGSFKDAAISAIKQVIAEFIRLQLLKAAFSLFGGGGGFGGGGLSDPGFGFASQGSLVPSLGFASGGGFNVLGRSGVDKNIMSINGLPIARVSHGERVNIGSGDKMGGGISMHFAFSGPVSRETQTQVAAAARRGIAQANRKGV